MPDERDEASEHLAGFIVDALHDADVVAASDMARATSVAAQEINVSKAMGGYWCSWCSHQPEPSSTWVNVSDERISFAAEGFVVQVIRLRPLREDGRIAVEIQARAHGFGGRYTTEIHVDDLLGFVASLRDSHDPRGRDHTTTLRSVTGDIVIEFRTHLGSVTGRYLFRSGSGDSDAATLSGSFRTDAGTLARLGREVKGLVHDSWGRT